MSISSRVRQLMVDYERKVEILTDQYTEELEALQKMCLHSNVTRWQYFTTDKAEVACTAEGILIQKRECLDCGLEQTRLDVVCTEIKMDE